MVLNSIIGFLNYRKNEIVVRPQNPISIYNQHKPELPVSALAIVFRLNEGQTAQPLVKVFLD